MIKILPFFAGFITLLFSFGFGYLITRPNNPTPKKIIEQKDVELDDLDIIAESVPTETIIIEQDMIEPIVIEPKSVD